MVSHQKLLPKKFRVPEKKSGLKKVLDFQASTHMLLTKSSWMTSEHLLELVRRSRQFYDVIKFSFQS